MEVIKEQCPWLNKCKNASGIDCANRDYENCDFYNHLIKQLWANPETTHMVQRIQKGSYTYFKLKEKYRKKS